MLDKALAVIKECLNVIEKVEQRSQQEHTITYDDLLNLYNILGLFCAN